MFIVLLTYKASLEEVDRYLLAHRSFLDEGYQQNLLIASGPKNPRVGGVLLSQLTDRAQLDSFLQKDPFYLHAIAEYEIIEFNPVKWHKNFEGFIQ
jgi:uncharacterized protein YciI